MDKFFNYNFITEASERIPESQGDFFYGQDQNRGFHFLMDQINHIWKAMFDIDFADHDESYLLQANISVTPATDTLNIDDTVVMFMPEKELAGDMGVAIPPTTSNERIPFRVNIAGAWNLVTLGATLDGATTNYLVAAYNEIDANTRGRAKKAGSYAYEKQLSYTLSIVTSAPTLNPDQYLLATFIGTSGGPYTFNASEPDHQPVDLYTNNLMRADIDMNGFILSNSADPTDPAHIGDLGFNDTRYGPEGLYEGIIKDPSFREQHWDTSDSQVSYGTSGADGKESLDFVANSTDNDSVYINPIHGEYIPALSLQSIHFLMRLKYSGTLGGTTDLFRVKLERYNKSLTLLGTEVFSLNSTDLSLTFNTQMGALGFKAAVGDATAFVKILLSQGANMTSGIVHVDVFQASFNSILHTIQDMLASGIYSSYYVPENGILGVTGEFWYETAAAVTLTGTIVNTLVPGSRNHPFQVKSVAVHVFMDATGDFVRVFEDSTGTTHMLSTSSSTYWVLRGGTGSGNAIIVVPIPISFYNSSTGEAYLRWESGASTVDVNILGYKL